MKKLVLIAVALIIVGGVFFPEISRFGSSYALKPENKDKSWAPNLCFTVANINMRFFRFEAAQGIYASCRTTWPEAEYLPDLDYKVAACKEKTGDLEGAKAAYRSFMAAYPDHKWHDQAAKRISTIEANQEL